MKYITPQTLKESFTCPHCGVLSKQDWIVEKWEDTNKYHAHVISGDPNRYPLTTSTCQHCNEHTLWVEGIMYYPDFGSAPLPNEDMPERVIELYNEASSIFNKSPRGAGGLLRLGIQELVIALGEKGKNINTDIGNLVSKGLPPMIQKSLDSVRVIGNDAVHPGQIDTDDPKVVESLFGLINIIVQYMITMPKQVDGIYGSLPEDKIKGIENRDQ